MFRLTVVNVLMGFWSKTTEALGGFFKEGFTWISNKVLADFQRDFGSNSYEN
jgi:hypothetical protein